MKRKRQRPSLRHNQPSPRSNPSGSPEWSKYLLAEGALGHRGGERNIGRGWTKNPSDDRLFDAAREQYLDLHGIEPEQMVEQKLPKQPKMLVDLGPVTRVCYTKRILSDLPEHQHLPKEQKPIIKPEYCHQYGEGWPSEKFEDLADRAAATEEGNLYIVPRGNTVVTARGIEDKPVKKDHAVRANPESTRSRRNPVEERLALGKVQVRTPSAFSILMKNILGGAVGVPLPVILNATVLHGTSLSSAERAAVTAAVSMIAGVIVGRKSPKIGVGIAAAGMGLAGKDAFEWLQQRNLHAVVTSAPPVEAPREQSREPSPVTTG